jgi:hypothetical protein
MPGGMPSEVMSEDKCNSMMIECMPGIILPIWMPRENISTGTIVGRAILYSICFIYIIAGLKVITEKFMESIDVIMAHERKVKFKDSNGKIEIVNRKYWNDTIGTLIVICFSFLFINYLLFNKYIYKNS